MSDATLVCERCGQRIFWGFPRADDPCPNCGRSVRVPAAERTGADADITGAAVEAAVAANERVNRFVEALRASYAVDGDPYDDGERDDLLDVDVAAANIARILEVATGHTVDGDGDPWTVVCDAVIATMTVIDDARTQFASLDAWLRDEHGWAPLPGHPVHGTT